MYVQCLLTSFEIWNYFCWKLWCSRPSNIFIILLAGCCVRFKSYKWSECFPQILDIFNLVTMTFECQRNWRSRFSNNSLLYPLYPLPFAKGDQIGVFFRIRQHETTKTEVLCQSRYGTIKIPPCSNIIGVEQQWSKFSIPSPLLMSSPWKRNILEWDVTQKKQPSKKDSYCVLKEDLKKYPLYTYIDLSRTCRFKYPFILHSDLNGKFSL